MRFLIENQTWAENQSLPFPWAVAAIVFILSADFDDVIASSGARASHYLKMSGFLLNIIIKLAQFKKILKLCHSDGPF